MCNYRIFGMTPETKNPNNTSYYLYASSRAWIVLSSCIRNASITKTHATYVYIIGVVNGNNACASRFTPCAIKTLSRMSEWCGAWQ